jgi:hypothetical protein
VPVPTPEPPPPPVPPPRAPHRVFGNEAPAPLLLPVVAVKGSPAAMPRAQRPAVQIGVATGLGLAIEPGTALGVAVDVGVRWPLVSIAVEGRGDFSADAVSVSAWRVTGALVPCWRWKVIFGCAVGEVGAVVATGTADHTLTKILRTAAAGPRVGAVLPINDHFAARLSAEAIELRHEDGGPWLPS